MDYWTVAVAGVEAAFELVRVTVTEEIELRLPVMVNGMVSLNWDPVAKELGLAYQVVNMELTSVVKSVEARDAPAAGVK
jgi:hypothetical protein